VLSEPVVVHPESVRNTIAAAAKRFFRGMAFSDHGRLPKPQRARHKTFHQIVCNGKRTVTDRAILIMGLAMAAGGGGP
jgi:hypothetical protein